MTREPTKPAAVGDGSFSSEKCLEARRLLGWTRDRLAIRARLNVSTLMRFELAIGHTQASNVASARAALEAAGVEFSNDGPAGVRLTEHMGKPHAIFVWRSLSNPGLVGFADRDDHPAYRCDDWEAVGSIYDAELPSDAKKTARRKVLAGQVFKGFIDSQGVFTW